MAKSDYTDHDKIREKIVAREAQRLYRKKRLATPGNSGVYVITHTPSGRVYVGSSACVPERIVAHKGLLRRGVHHSKAMQEAYSSDGHDAFDFKMVVCCSQDDLLHFEQMFIDCYDPSFNTFRFAGSGKGLVHTPETKARISIGNTGKDRPQEMRDRIAEKLKGRKCDPEVVRRRSAKLKGRKRSRSAIEKTMSGVRGVPKSEEHRAKLSSANARFSEFEVKDIREMRASGRSYREIGEKYGINQATVGKIVTRERYKWVT